MTSRRGLHSMPVPRRTTLLRRCLAGSALIALSYAGSAAAQGYSQGFYGYGPRVVVEEDLLSPRAVAYSLHDRGFTEVGRPRWDGRAYLVDATSPSGRRLRLALDPRDGAVIGRRPLEIGYGAPPVPPRGLPGYGWTEQDRPERPIREAERLVPPADIPSVPRTLRPPPPARIEVAPPSVATEGAPYGVNPDARTQPRPAPGRRTARLAPPAVPGANPVKPAPKSAPVETPSAATSPTAPQPLAVPQQEEPRAADRSPAPSNETPRPISPEAPKTAEPSKAATGDAKPDGMAWQDPPGDGARKSVRVIGGATVVPGTTAEQPPAN